MPLSVAARRVPTHAALAPHRARWPGLPREAEVLLARVENPD